MSSAQQLRFLALGDSYTIGHNVEIAERWPVQLVERLRGEGINISDAEIIAVSGWTTNQLQEAVKTTVPQGPFDIVTLMIGVNNQYQGLDIDQYRSEFVDLLHQSVAFGKGDPSKVIVVSIPDWSVTPFAEGKNRAEAATKIDEFNAVNETEVAKVGGRYVDVTPISRRAEYEPHLLSSDGLHPSGAMYKLWVGIIVPECRAAMSGR